MNIERKLLTGYGIFGYGIICAIEVRDIVKRSRSQAQELSKNQIAEVLFRLFLCLSMR
ncbi:hypothetical protein QUB80_06200 [Chlorogloeopsis sp. ULAP01]|uniref:hypothetical protein n=1 Tax=Chlorogloeopsis sp. ULAP01 TaxID=3056483 RepID=UPI0025AAC981|nr:hypothetical protein [Chlorogloeopsis sp. ULAP01]MDM9380294.1 hypothetical protein [Chlorogloeopsis sp. ULAP01]